MVRRKYRSLFSSSHAGRKPGPKGPSPELIAAILEVKARNPRFEYQRISQQLAYDFDIELDKEAVRRVVAKHYGPNGSGSNGPSWLTVFAQAKDNLRSIDLFCVESIVLRSYWVMAVLDVFTRRIVGFGIECGDIDGIDVCRIFRQATADQSMPQRVSTDHDPLFQFHRWRAQLRALGIVEIKSIPYIPTSHPFVERLIGALRREYLDHFFFWNSLELSRKFASYRVYDNEVRVHRALEGTLPAQCLALPPNRPVQLSRYAWHAHCGGIFQTLTAV